MEHVAIGISLFFGLITLLTLFTFWTAVAGRVDLHLLTVIHTVRAPLAVMLHLYASAGLASSELTFGGGNFDMLAGLTAPLIYYYGVLKNKIKWPLLISWNLLSICSLLRFGLNYFVSVTANNSNSIFQYEESTVVEISLAVLPMWILPILLSAHLLMIRNWWIEIVRRQRLV